jgi:hypothetical protein
MSNDPKRTCPSHGPMVKIDGQGRLGKPPPPPKPETIAADQQWIRVALSSISEKWKLV